MVLFTRENGMRLQIREMARVSKFGLMVLYMRVFGKMTKQTERGDLFMQIKMYTKVIGSMIRLTGMENIYI